MRNLCVALGTTGALAALPSAAQARSLYVANYNGGGSVSVVNTTTNTVTATIPMAGGPWLAAVAPNGKTAYIVQYDTGKIVPITVSTGDVGTPITINGASAPYDLGITPDGSTAYVANEGAGTITPINLATGASDAPISVGGTNSDNTYALSISPNGKTVYASNYGTSQVVPVNVATSTAGTPISVPGAYFSAISPDGRTLWVISYGDDDLVPINTSTGVAGTGIPIPGGTDLQDVTISPSGTMAYVTNGNGEEVFPVNLTTRSVGLPIPTGSSTYPEYITMTPDGKTVYPINDGGDSVTPISTATNSAGAPVAVGSGPGQGAVVPNQGPKAAFSHKVKAHKAALNGSRSSDSDGTVARYAWKFGDGSTKTTTSPRVSHTYKHAGHYHVTLTVTDNEGCSTKLVFTGQTAYCNGTKAAQVRHTVVIAKTKVKAKKTKTAPTFTG